MNNLNFNDHKLGFPRDGMSFCPFVPGQKYFLVPLSLCTGTRAGAKIPGQKKNVLKQEKDVLKQKR